MTMSKDRVKFKISAGLLCGREREEYARLLQEVLGISRASTLCHANGGRDMTIICRPSQFARFIIERSNRGMRNGIQVLEATLFIPEEGLPIYDVSNAPARS